MDNMDLLSALALIRRYGFDNVEIWANSVHLDPAIAPDVRGIAAYMKSAGMKTHSIHSPFDIRFDQPEDKKAYADYRMQQWSKTLEYCAELESGIMVIHAMNARYPFHVGEENQVHDFLGELCVRGKKLGVSVALENIVSNVKAGEIHCTLENQAKLYGDLEDLRFCLDIGHVALTNAQMKPEIDVVADRLVSFHVNNNDGRRDLHLTPDIGEIDWADTHDYIRSKGYTGTFVLEINGHGDGEKVLSHMAELFKRGGNG